MKNKLWLGAACLLVGLLAVYGCGKFDSSSSTGGEGGGNPPITTASLFDVSGATAIAAASGATTSTSAIKTMSAQNITELLKLNSAGQLTSVLSTALAAQWHPPISVIETHDGALYIGFQWGIWVSDNSTTESGNSAAFFKVAADGTTTIVDDDIYGVGSWYGGSENGELPVKQIQWDSDGNLYYIGKNSSGNSMLKKKTTAGVISQIGSSNYEVRDFLVADNGLVFFHGSNVGNWSIEWLRVIKNSTVNNIFYNDGQGWLRAYYKDASNNVYLVGENLTLLGANDVPQKYSGIIKATLTSNGTPSAVAAVYDDNNMYSDNWGTIGDQLVWGYWDPVDQEQKYFFSRDTYNQVILPLSFEAGVTEETVRTYIRQKYQSRTEDNLDSLTLEAHPATAPSSMEPWQVTNWLNDIIPTYITGTTWTKWKRDNDLQNIRFGNAKQLLFSEDNELYAVMRLDNWGTGSSRGDKLFRIVNASGEAKPVAYLQDTTSSYKTMSKARLYGNYCVYLSSKVGYYKIFRLDLTNSAALPVDMIPGRSNIEIFGFNFNETDSKLYYDVYDLSNNTSYLAQQDISSTTGATEVSAEGYTITEIVPFTASQ